MCYPSAPPRPSSRTGVSSYDHWVAVEVVDEFENALLELVLGGDADVTEYGGAALAKKPSTRLSHDPRLGVKTNWKRPSGRAASQVLVSREICAEF